MSETSTFSQQVSTRTRYRFESGGLIFTEISSNGFPKHSGRWEIYDPTKTYGKYTIGGGVVTKKDGT